MKWLGKLLGTENPPATVSVTITPPEIRRGLPVYEAEIQGSKLERREIRVTLNGDVEKFSINTLRQILASSRGVRAFANLMISIASRGMQLAVFRASAPSGRGEGSCSALPVS